MNVLVTGGSGFIGRYFHQTLSAAGHRITILDLVEPVWDPGASRVVIGDVRDPVAVRQALTGCDAILNLAAAHHDFGIARETFFSVNEGGARVLCAAAEEAGVNNICFFSTVAVYGTTPEPRHEDSPTQPISPYGQSKLAAERVFQAWTAAGNGRRCVVIRPTVVFGPRNFANMYALIRQVDSGFFFRVGSGGNVKSLAYVENLVAAALFLWQRPAEKPFEVFNYVDKPDLNTRSLLGAIYQALGRRLPRIYLPLKLALVAAAPFDLAIKVSRRNLPISTARIRKMSTQTRFEAERVLRAGFRPAVPLLEGVARMVRWYQSDGRRERPDPHLPPAALRNGSTARTSRPSLGDEA